MEVALLLLSWLVQEGGGNGNEQQQQWFNSLRKEGTLGVDGVDDAQVDAWHRPRP